MDKLVLAAMAVCASATCAATDVGGWQVPGNWEVRISEKGAVQEWTGKTWCGHIQGMCATSNALYFVFHNQIVKTDLVGAAAEARRESREASRRHLLVERPPLHDRPQFPRFKAKNHLKTLSL